MRPNGRRNEPGSSASRAGLVAALALIAAVGMLVIQLGLQEKAPDSTTLALLVLAAGLAFALFAFDFACALLSDRDPQLDALPTRARDKFLDRAWSFADGFAFAIWGRFVRDELRGAGWELFDPWRNDAPKRWFLAHRSEGWAAMTARVGEPSPFITGRLGTSSRP